MTGESSKETVSAISSHSPAREFRTPFLIGVALAAVLVAYGVFRVPAVLTASKSGWRSLIGVSLVLAAYAFAGRAVIAWLARRDVWVVRVAWRLGLIASAIFGGEIILEYIVLPKNNTTFGLVEFGSVFFLYFAAALWTTANRRAWLSGVQASTMTAVFASLGWYIFVLTICYAFMGTDRQIQVLLAEGDFEDFKRSGMTDFAAFKVEDNFGAGFFHLTLIGPVAAAILGSLGGLIGMGLRRFVLPTAQP